jgi:hypothetical protein
MIISAVVALFFRANLPISGLRGRHVLFYYLFWHDEWNLLI